MTLQELLDDLANQELKNLATTEEEEGTGTYSIADKHIPGIVGHINSGLTDLFSKFELKIKEIIITTHPAITNYELSCSFAKSNPDRVIFKYINDNVNDPFLDDIIKIKYIVNEYSEVMPYNDITNAASILTLSYNTIKINNNQNNAKYSVVYTAKHKKIEGYKTLTGTTGGEGYVYKYADADGKPVDKSAEGAVKTSIAYDGTQPIEIHPSLVEPLRLYVKSKVIASRDGSDISSSVQILQTYNLMLTELLNSGIIKLDIDSGDTKFEDRGFV